VSAVTTESDAVRLWFSSAGHDSAPREVQDRYLAVLEGFVTHRGMSPDELVAYCFLRKKETGERFLSITRRVAMNEWIEQFVAAQGWTGKDAVANANVIRGFMIHNGVVIQGKVWTSG
jgi:hypothetical protein